MAKKSRNTQQKEKIQSVIDETEGFFNAEELHQKVAMKDPKIGIATVYRYLGHLKNKNLLHTYTCNRRTIFSKNEKSHCHFNCTECGKVEHIKISSLEFIKGKIPTEDICHFQIEVSGICKACKKNKH